MVPDSTAVSTITGTPAGTDEKPSDETEDPKPVKASLQLTANEYKVGFLGGISQLELSVNNPSPLTIHKAVVEVDFLKPNGKVIHTETIEVSGIAPGSSKKIAVPDNSRGVSVRYRVVTVET